MLVCDIVYLMGNVFITGAAGLIGRAVRQELQARGFVVGGCDLRSTIPSERFDFRNDRKIRDALVNYDGVLHLGALSRVVWGETYPDLCQNINIDGTRGLMKAVGELSRRMWFVFASSREVYGTPARLPCTSSTPLNPENVYAKSKLAGEHMVEDLRRHGIRVAVVRFSNVFGDTEDYHDRVVPAFAKAAASGGVLYVRGGGSIFDFTPLADAVRAAVAVVEAVHAGVSDLPTMDIVTGRATSLLELAQMALAHGTGDIVMEDRLSFYPSRFQGDPSPAEKHLGWIPCESMEESVGRLVEGFKQAKEQAHANTQNYSWLSAAL